jgi:Tfp pilus assembly ATPase PilU
LDLYDEGVISKEQALSNATSASDLALKISGLTSGKVINTEISSSVENSHDDIFDLK